MKSAKDRMDIISAYQQLGSYRAAAEVCHTTPKTVKRVVDRFEAGDAPVARVERAHNYDEVADLVTERGATVARLTIRDRATETGFELTASLAALIDDWHSDQP